VLKLKSGAAAEHLPTLVIGESSPDTGWNIPEPEKSDPHPDEAQSGVSDGGGHATDLAVFAFSESEGDPASRNRLSEPDGRFARREIRLRLEEPRAARPDAASLNHQVLFELPQCGRFRNAFDLDPILAFVSAGGMQEAMVQIRFIAQKQKTLRIRIQPSDRVNPFWKTKLRQRAVARSISGELRKHPVRFVERE
jgi:hypothetical protein